MLTITSTMIQLLNLKEIFRGTVGEDANQHLMNFMATPKSAYIYPKAEEIPKPWPH